MANKSAWSLAGFVALCLAAGGLGSVVTAPQIPAWYATLAKPEWNPPNWIFVPVWTTLYVLMAVAAWLVWRQREQQEVRVALALFGVQLALNTLWSFIFFAWERPGTAFIEIMMMWLAIAATLVAFRRISRAAGWLLAPYLAWVSFASVLNFAIWRLNR